MEAVYGNSSRCLPAVEFIPPAKLLWSSTVRRRWKRLRLTSRGAWAIVQFQACCPCSGQRPYLLPDSQSTIRANRLSLREWEEDALPLFMASTKSDIGQMQQLLVEQQSPVVLTIEMRGNDVVGAYQSPAA